VLGSWEWRSATVLRILWVQSIGTHVLVLNGMSIVEWMAILDGLLLLLSFLFRLLFFVVRARRAVFLLFLLLVRVPSPPLPLSSLELRWITRHVLHEF